MKYPNQMSLLIIYHRKVYIVVCFSIVVKTMAKQNIEHKCKCFNQTTLLEIAETLKNVHRTVTELDAKVDHLIEFYHFDHYKKTDKSLSYLNGTYQK